MKSFNDKTKFNVKGIYLILLMLNTFWFGLLIFNRLNFANSDTVQGAKEFGLFCLYFFSLLTCIILSGFELRLINENKHRVFKIEAKVDYFVRLTTFGLSMLLAALNLSVKNQIIAMLCEFAMLTMYELIFIVLRCKEKVIIVDWTNKFYISRSNENSSVNNVVKHSEVKLNIFKSIYFIGLIILTFFAVGIVAIPIWSIIIIISFYATGVFLLIFYKIGCKLLPILSGIGTIIVLAASYFVSIYVYNLSFLFLFANCIVQIPFIKSIYLKDD